MVRRRSTSSVGRCSLQQRHLLCVAAALDVVRGLGRKMFWDEACGALYRWMKLEQVVPDARLWGVMLGD